MVRLEYAGELTIFTDQDDYEEAPEAAPALITEKARIDHILGHSDITTLERAALNRRSTEIRIGIDSNIVVALFPTYFWQAAR